MQIDKNGIWYYQGAEMTRQDIIHYFYQHLRKDTHGHYWIEIERNRCSVAVEDAPYIVTSVTIGTAKNDCQPCIEVSLSDGCKEELTIDNPFWIGDNNALYCSVKKGEHSARFSRPAYYQLCQYIEYNSKREEYCVTVNKYSFPLVLINKTLQGGSNVR